MKNRLPSDLRSYLPFLAYLLVLVLLMPRARKFDYEYRSGAPWRYESLVSEFDFPIYKTEEQMLKELADAELSAIPYFKYSETADAKNLRVAESISLGAGDSIRPVLLNSLRGIYRQGVIADDFSKEDRRLALSDNLIYVQRGKRASKYPISDVYRLSQAKTQLINDLRFSFPSAPVDSALAASGLLDVMEPNLLFDRRMTEMVHSDERHDISPTQGYVPAGSLIVSEGEIVTAEVSQMLDSYKKEYNETLGADLPSVWIWLSNFMLALILTCLLFWTVQFSDPTLFSRKNETLYIVFVALLCAVSVLLLDRFGSNDLVYLIPWTLFALYLQAFFPNRTIAPVYLVSLLPMAVFLPQGVTNYALYALAGFLAIQLFDRFNRGW